MKKLFSLIFLSVSSIVAFAQDSTQSHLKISGYLEAYYGYDFNQPKNGNRPGFVYSHNRHNEFNLNLGFIKAAYDNGNVRANLAVMAGTYANANLAAEPGVLKNIYEANAGVKLAKNANLWLDAGIFASHIGFESAVSKECWTLTRTILAENSPYYEAGAKLTYITNNDQWTLTGLVLNGWQRIQRVEGNSSIGLGTQIQYKPTDKITLNSSTFFGNDKPDSVKQNRYFHNFYGIFQLSEKFGLTTGFDFGWEQKAKGSSAYNTWYSPVLIARYQFADKWFAAARGEYYRDKNDVIISTGTPQGFQTFGYSLDVDYAPFANAVIRLEGKMYTGSDAVFTWDNRASANNALLTTSIALNF
ncbi:MAG: porin [Mucilaginibacter polytrichastri]|nr:porin [Mucilaginibacter polytrichastri]